jgi:hypothetical protein
VLDWVEATRDHVVSSAPALVAALQAELERRLTS